MAEQSLPQKMMLLDRLEELREDMDDLGVSSREELEQRIAALEQEIGDIDDAAVFDGSL